MLWAARRAARRPAAAAGRRRGLAGRGGGFLDARGRRFEDLGVTAPFLLAALEARGAAAASAVQAEALPRLLPEGGPAVVVAAETGSGKTLAYLVPVIERLAAAAGADAAAGDGGPPPPPPQVVVAVPGRDLVDQVAGEAAALLEGGGALAVTALVGADRPPPLSLPPGVVVSTPSCLAAQPDSFWERRRTLCAVFDEADLLLGSSARDVLALVRRLRRPGLLPPPPPRTVFVGATLPEGGREFVRRHFPGAVTASTPLLHAGRHNPAVRQRWEEALAGETLAGTARRLLGDELPPRALVFVNSAAAADEVAAALGPPAAAFHRDVPSASRRALLDRFAGGGVVLVCTDLASRGIDYGGGGGADLVVQLEFARSAVDHLHRVGRTGRAGRGSGEVINVVPAGGDRALASAVREATEAGRPLAEAFSRRRGFRRRHRRKHDARRAARP